MKTEEKSEEEVKDMFVPLLHGLVYLHSQDVCHRDLKPYNIMLLGRCVATHACVTVDVGVGVGVGVNVGVGVGMGMGKAMAIGIGVFLDGDVGVRVGFGCCCGV